MPVFGITGSLASGKTTVVRLLREKGALVFNADKVIHRYYQDKNSQVYKKISRLFPEVLKGKAICRKELAKIVFSDFKQLEKLESIVHPVIIRDLKKWIKEHKTTKRICVAEVPLMFEKKLQSNFQGVILVYTKRNILIKRIMNKLGIQRKEAVRRLSFFVPLKTKLRAADFVVYNNGGVGELKKQIISLWLSLNNKEK